MRTSTAFFAGAGTMVMVVAGGLGGGLMIANTMNPKTMNPKTPAMQATKLERRAAEPSQAPSPSPSPRPAATQAASTPAAGDAAAQGGQDGVKAQSSATMANRPATSAPSPAPSPSSQATQRDAHDKMGAGDAAFAKAEDTDLKTPDADNKHSAEKRHGRHQRQWVERRRMQYQPEGAPRDAEQALRDDGDARSVRDERNARSYPDDGGARVYRGESRARGYPDDGNARHYRDGNGPDRDYAAEPVELELPRIRLFDGF
jgi:hypothetical protein